MIKVRFVHLESQFHRKVIEMEVVPRIGEMVQFQSSREPGNISKVVMVTWRPYSEEECKVDVMVRDISGLFTTDDMVPLNEDNDPRVTMVATE